MNAALALRYAASCRMRHVAKSAYALHVLLAPPHEVREWFPDVFKFLRDNAEVITKSGDFVMAKSPQGVGKHSLIGIKFGIKFGFDHLVAPFIAMPIFITS
jgi:hypothetical protein